MAPAPSPVRVPQEMGLVILRHAETPGNAQHRYVGSTDEPLSEAGLSAARVLGERVSLMRNGASADAMPLPKVVYVSPLIRARQTAAAVFPQAEQRIVPGFAEMDFGAFEGRTADEMADDPAYREWVDAWCETACPGGESRADFVARTVRAFAELASAAARRGEGELVIVAHGGTVMAIMSAFAHSACARPYFDWHVANCGGYRAELRFAASEKAEASAGAAFEQASAESVAGSVPARPAARAAARPAARPAARADAPGTADAAGTAGIVLTNPSPWPPRP